MNKIKGSPLLASLTIDQFFQLQAQENHSKTPETTDKRHYVYGIKGLMEITGYKRRAAQNLKSSGRISYSQNGRKLIFNIDTVLSELSKPKTL